MNRHENMTTVITSDPVKSIRFLNPLAMARNLWRYRGLLKQFTYREIQKRYRGSYLGVLWSIITPLVMLLAYTFVFSIIFKAKWKNLGLEGISDFALVMFSGIIAFNVFAECVSQAPLLMLNNPNYVKKVVFPIEILPLSLLGSVLFHSVISLGILIIGQLIFYHKIQWTLVFLPLVFLPLSMLSAGFTWFLSGLGVFVRDIGNFIVVAVQLLFFVTPIFYPPSAVPEHLRFVLWLNPLHPIVEDVRRVTMWGMPPDWPLWGLTTILSAIAALIGYMFFMRLKGAYADVL